MEDFETLGIDDSRALVVEVRQRRALGRFTVVSALAVCSTLSVLGIVVLSR